MSHDRELTAEVTRSANRLHALLLAVCPPLEELMAGKKIQGGLALLLLERYGGPCGLRTAGRGRAKRFVRSRKGFGGASGAKVDRVFDAISEQTLVLPGAEDLEDLIRMEARRLSSALESRKTVAKKRDAILEAIPEAEILMSMPGVGAVTCATFLAEVGDVTRFPTAARLASYAGLSPKVRQSGRSVNSVTKPRGGEPKAEARAGPFGEQIDTVLRRIAQVLRAEAGRGEVLQLVDNRPRQKEARRHVRDAERRQ